MSTITRAYKYRAFQPKSGVEAFDFAIGLKREMWAELCAMEVDLSERREPIFAVPKEERDMVALAALKQERVDCVREIKQKFAARGLAWGDYNATEANFRGAVQAAAKRKAMPTPSDDALGDCVVRQIMGGARPHTMLSRNDVFIEYLPNEQKKSELQKGSHRSGYRLARMTFLIRSDRNPAGLAEMELDFVLHQPLPLEGSIVEVRIIRTVRKIINKEGLVRERPDWHVIFVARISVVKRITQNTAGVALTWKQDEDGGTVMAVVSDRGGPRYIYFDNRHSGQWDSYREKRALAEETNDDALAAEANILLKRLIAQRRLYLRTEAKQIIRDTGAVAVDGTFLHGTGNKNNSAPATFRLELQRAAENAGCAFFKVKIGEKNERIRAGMLRKEAENLLKNDENVCENQTVKT